MKDKPNLFYEGTWLGRPSKCFEDTRAAKESQGSKWFLRAKKRDCTSDVIY